MAKLPRETLQVFGLGGTTNDFEEFGSTANGLTVYTKDIPTIQSLPAWTNGWRPALVATKAPVLQDMNAEMFVHSYMQAYTFQEGICEWDIGTTYYIGSVVKKVSSQEIYVSLIDANLGNALPSRVSDGNWAYCGLITTPGKLSAYRRPVVQWVDGTHVQIESGLDGTSGDVIIVYGDGEMRLTNSLTLTKASTGTVAVLSGGGKTAGIRTGSVPTNAWGHCYSVKATDSADNILVIDFTNDFAPAANSTLNGYWGVNGWIYLGKIRIGDQGSTNSGILKFVQAGNKTLFYNRATGSHFSNGILAGMVLANPANGTTASWTYASGISGDVVPLSISIGIFQGFGQGGGAINYSDQPGNVYYARNTVAAGSNFFGATWEAPISQGVAMNQGGSGELDLTLAGFIDGALGVGPNPIF